MDWTQQLDFTWQLVLATLFALPIAWDRERSDRIMGMRTFPLVAVSTCGLTLVGQSFISPASDDALARIIQGIVTGIGFLGGGAIIKNEDRVAGTATAASIWLTGIMGIAVGVRAYAVAFVLTLANFLILRTMRHLKEPERQEDPELDRGADERS